MTDTYMRGLELDLDLAKAQVAKLEFENGQMQLEIDSYKILLGQINSRIEQGLPIEIGGKVYVVYMEQKYMEQKQFYTRAELDAAVAATLQRAMDFVVREGSEFGGVTQIDVTIRRILDQIIKAQNALITADATAALAERDKRVRDNLLIEADSYKSVLAQIEAQARDGLPIEIGGRQYVPSADLAEAAQEARARALDADRFRYVLEGVRRAIKTGRNEPLAIWADQIDIALQATAKGGAI